MCENVFCKGSETIFTNKAFRMLTGLRHYKLLGTEMYDDSVSVKVFSKLSYAKCPVCGRQSHSVHSHYERHLLTLPMYDRAMHIRSWFIRLDGWIRYGNPPNNPISLAVSERKSIRLLLHPIYCKNRLL